MNCLFKKSILHVKLWSLLIHERLLHSFLSKEISWSMSVTLKYQSERETTEWRTCPSHKRYSESLTTMISGRESKETTTTSLETRRQTRKCSLLVKWIYDALISFLVSLASKVRIPNSHDDDWRHDPMCMKKKILVFLFKETETSYLVKELLAKEFFPFCQKDCLLYCVVVQLDLRRTCKQD